MISDEIALKSQVYVNQISNKIISNYQIYDKIEY